MEKGLVPHLNKFESHHLWIPYVKFAWNWTIGSQNHWANYKQTYRPGEEDLVVIGNLFWLFFPLSPLGEGHGPSFDQFKFPSPKDILSQVWMKLVQWFWRKFFKVYYFRYFAIIAPWDRAWPFIWTNLTLHYPIIFCAKLGWNWHSGSGEEEKNMKSLWWWWWTKDRIFWTEKLTWAFDSGELKNKTSYFKPN